MTPVRVCADNGLMGALTLRGNGSQPELGADVRNLTLTVENITPLILRTKISAPGRWEVPRSLLNAPNLTGARRRFLAANPSPTARPAVVLSRSCLPVLPAGLRRAGLRGGRVKSPVIRAVTLAWENSGSALRCLPCGAAVRRRAHSQDRPGGAARAASGGPATYTFNYSAAPFSFAISRSSSNAAPVFNTAGTRLVFKARRAARPSPCACLQVWVDR